MTRRWRTLVAAGLSLLPGLLGSRPARAEPIPAPAPKEIVISSHPAVGPPVACWAVPGRTPADCGGYIGGGGGLFHTGPRAINQGTWGWDYQGWYCLRKVFLPWNQGRLYQGGEGAYRVNGPRIYNVFAVPPPPEPKQGADH